MKNKNELKVIEQKKKTGQILLGIGIFIFIISVISIICSFSAYTKSTLNMNTNNAINNMLVFILGDIFSLIGLGLLITGIVFIVINNNKIKDYTKETIIPKAKETFNKVEPIVTDVAKTIGNGIEQTAKDIKDTINKRRNKKEGK